MHDTVYSPTRLAVTSVAVELVPAPDGDSASACVNVVTGLSNASNTRHVTPSATPASVVGRASCVIARAGGPATIVIAAGVGSTSARLGAEQRTVAVPTSAASTWPSEPVKNDSCASYSMTNAVLSVNESPCASSAGSPFASTIEQRAPTGSPAASVGLATLVSTAIVGRMLSPQPAAAVATSAKTSVRITPPGLSMIHPPSVRDG